jgi:hypothetical protein
MSGLGAGTTVRYIMPEVGLPTDVRSESEASSATIC